MQFSAFLPGGLIASRKEHDQTTQFTRSDWDLHCLPKSIFCLCDIGHR